MMNDIEHELKSLLRTKADEIRQPDHVPHPVLRRARVRRAAAASVLCVALLTVGLGSIAVSRNLMAADPIDPAGTELLDDSNLTEDLHPAGDVHVIATTVTERGPMTSLGWMTSENALCVQLVIDESALSTSCLPEPGMSRGELHLSDGHYRGWRNRVVEGWVGSTVERLEARLDDGDVVPLRIHDTPDGLDTSGLRFVMANSIPANATGKIVARDTAGKRVGMEPLVALAVSADEQFTVRPRGFTVLGSTTTRNPYTVTVRNAQSQPVQGATIDVEQRAGKSIDLVADMDDGLCLGFQTAGTYGTYCGSLSAPLVAEPVGSIEGRQAVVGTAPFATDELIIRTGDARRRKLHALVLADLPDAWGVDARAFLVMLPRGRWTLEALEGGVVLNRHHLNLRDRGGSESDGTFTFCQQDGDGSPFIRALESLLPLPVTECVESSSGTMSRGVRPQPAPAERTKKAND